METAIKNFLSCNGSGVGVGYGSGVGVGYGDGDGGGYSNSNGGGGGVGYSNGGYKITKINNENVYYVDTIPCVFRSVHQNWAKVSVIDQVIFTLSDAFIAKLDGQFAHGETIKKAFAAVTEKVLGNMDIKEKKSAFLKQFPEYNVEYPVADFFSWHKIMTGSCEFGRLQFAKENNIDLDGSMTVEQFIDLTGGEYGCEYIKELEGIYE